MPLLVAFTEAERIAIIGIVASIAAGVPGIIAAIITHRTRTENSEQHGESQQKLEEVRDAVIHHSVKIEEVGNDVKDLTIKVDKHSNHLARHAMQIERHSELLERTTRNMTSEDDDPHPVL